MDEKRMKRKLANFRALYAALMSMPEMTDKDGDFHRTYIEPFGLDLEIPLRDEQLPGDPGRRRL